MRNLSAACLAAALLTISLGIVIARRICRSLSDTTAMARRIATGDLSQSLSDASTTNWGNSP